jgi:hypothetical protein
MWIDAFNNHLGANLSLWPAQPPKAGAPGSAGQKASVPPGPHITFRWGDTPGDEAGYVGTGGVGGFWNVRPMDNVLTLSNQPLWYVPDPAIPPGPDSFKLDLRGATAHELGHLFGLDHLANPGSVMQPKMDTGKAFPSEIFDLDRGRLRARYGDILF